MTRTKFAPLFLSLSALLALAGCGGDTGLTASGQAVVTDSAGTASGFNFPAGVRLDGGGGGTTGMCQISRGAPGTYGVVIDLYNNAQGLGSAVRSMTIMAHSDAATSGQVSAELGANEFTSAAGACSVAVTDLDEGRGNVAISATSCTLTHGTDTATATVSLTFSGCTVI